MQYFLIFYSLIKKRVSSVVQLVARQGKGRKKCDLLSLQFFPGDSRTPKGEYEKEKRFLVINRE